METKKYTISEINRAFHISYPVTSFDAEFKREKHYNEMIKVLEQEK